MQGVEGEIGERRRKLNVLLRADLKRNAPEDEFRHFWREKGEVLVLNARSNV